MARRVILGRGPGRAHCGRAGPTLGRPVAGLAVTLFICHVGYEVTIDVCRRLLDGVDDGVLVAAENAAAGVSGIEHAHAYARWTGRTLRIEIEAWVNPTLSVQDADELGRLASNAVHDAVPQARAISFTPRATPSPFELCASR